jgi:tripartite-type tricarboxylate transporter receptor subunit TctC
MIPPTTRRRAMAWMAAAGLAPAAFAQDKWPSRPIKLVVPFSPGGSTDVIARLFAVRMGRTLGTTIIVENQAGANGAIGSANVMHAAPDGYTLLVSSVAPHGLSPAAGIKLPYDALKDFRHLAILGRFPNALVVGPSVKAHSVAELVAESKAKPGTMSFGSSGSGSTPHLSGELLKVRTGLDAQHVPYKGSGPALVAVMGGELSFQFDNLVACIPFIQSGRLRALAVTGPNRSPLLKNVPTMAEAGVPDFVIESWLGLSAPARLPDVIAHKVTTAFLDAWKDPGLLPRLNEIGFEPPLGPPSSTNEFIANDIAKWRKLIAASGVKMDN